MLGVFAFLRLNSIDGVLLARARSYENVRSFEILKGLIVDAESSQRGFEITGDEHFLDRFEIAKKEISATLSSLEQNIETDGDQYQNLSRATPLINGQLSIIESAIIRKRAGGTFEKAEADRLKLAMDRLRLELDKIQQIENASLQDRIGEAAQARIFTRVALPIGGALAGAFIAAAVAVFSREGARAKTLRDELQLTREQAIEASNLKSAFLANMSHEIRTPMNGVLGLAELLTKTPLDDEQKKHVDSIQRSAVSLLSLINGILDLSKIESGKLDLETTYFELDQVVSDAVSTVEHGAKAKGVQLEKFIHVQVPRAFNGDPTRIRQILINLLNNAVKFTPQGRVTLNVRVLAKREDRTTIEFEVQDQGIGIDAETQKRLFTAFSQADETTTRRFGGTGLGLSIVKELIALMKGHVSLSSELGKGTTVTFSIPLEPVAFVKQSSTSQRKVFGPLPEAERLKLLVAEDNLINQQVVSGMLTSLGHQAVFANDGVQALEKFAKEDFDLVLMDCQMPEMDGFQATQEIRSLGHRDIPIIAITASAVRGDLEACIIAGMNDFISKPMSLSDLSTKLELWSPKGETSTQVFAPRVNAAGSSKLLSRDDQQALQKLFTEMALHFDAREFPELGEAATRLKGLSSSLGLVRVRTVAQNIESGWQTAELQALEFQFLLLSVEYNLALRHLAREPARV